MNRRKGPWSGLQEVKYATLEWIDWYNSKRILEPIGYVPGAVALGPDSRGATRA